jgi:hypothetical protein
MDAKQYGERDIEHARERIEAKQEEFAGGPEPGWEHLEQAAADARQEATDQSGATSIPTQQEAQPTQDTSPASAEHPVGVGKQCALCGAYNDLEAETCWHCSRPLPGEQASV